MNGPHNVSATFNPPTLFALTVTVGGNGTGTVTGPGITCLPDCSESYPAGTPVALTAAPTRRIGLRRLGRRLRGHHGADVQPDDERPAQRERDLHPADLPADAERAAERDRGRRCRRDSLPVRFLRLGPAAGYDLHGRLHAGSERDAAAGRRDRRPPLLDRRLCELRAGRVLCARDDAGPQRRRPVRLRQPWPRVVRPRSSAASTRLRLARRPRSTAPRWRRSPRAYRRSRSRWSRGRTAWKRSCWTSPREPGRSICRASRGWSVGACECSRATPCRSGPTRRCSSYRDGRESGSRSRSRSADDQRPSSSITPLTSRGQTVVASA